MGIIDELLCVKCLEQHMAHDEHYINVSDINVEPEMPGSQTFCLGKGQPDSHPLPSGESMRGVQAENGVVLILYSRDMPHLSQNFTRVNYRLHVRRLCGEKDESDSIISWDVAAFGKPPPGKASPLLLRSSRP